MTDNQELVRLSVSLSRGLLAELDRRITGRGYASRSELVRDLLREKLVEDTWSSDEEDVVGVLAISYDHHQRDLVQRIMDVQHR